MHYHDTKVIYLFTKIEEEKVFLRLIYAIITHKHTQKTNKQKNTRVVPMFIVKMFRNHKKYTS